MLNHPFAWNRHPRIEPLPTPYPWRRMAFNVLYALLIIALGVVVVGL